jgi:hypothetical protein
VLGWFHRVQFCKKNERKSGKYVVIKFKSSSFFARGQWPIKGFSRSILQMGNSQENRYCLDYFHHLDKICRTHLEHAGKLKVIKFLKIKFFVEYGLWSIQAGGTKSERVLPKNQHTQKKIIDF